MRALILGLTELVGLLIGFFGRKTITATATIAAFIAMTIAMMVCMREFETTLSALLTPPTWIVQSLGYFWPVHATLIFSTLLSARSCRAAYDYAVEKYKMINQAS